MTADETPLVPPFVAATLLSPPAPPSEPGRRRIPVVYIAGPFRAANPYLVRLNIARANALGHQVALLGAMPLIPHANTGEFDCALPQEFVLAGTMELLRRCDAAMAMEGWERSSGALGEHADAMARRQPWFECLTDLDAWIRGWVRP